MPTLDQPQAPTTVRLRHVFTVRGVAMGEYVEKPKDQVEAICRKHGRYAIPLWKHLKKLDVVRCQTQRLDPASRTWGRTVTTKPSL